MKVVENMTISFYGDIKVLHTGDSKLLKRGNKPLLRLFYKNQLRLERKKKAHRMNSSPVQLKCLGKNCENGITVRTFMTKRIRNITSHDMPYTCNSFK